MSGILLETATGFEAPNPIGGTRDQDRPFKFRTILAGCGIVVGFMIAFVAWSLLAPLDSAAIAPGVVIVDSNRKTVQHLEGGIVDAIRVQEGSRVRAGEILIQLQRTQPLALFNQVKAQYVETRAIEARLLAERDGIARIVFPDDLMVQAKDPAVAGILEGQTTIFASRAKLLSERLAILDQRIAKIKEEITGLRGQIAAATRQKSLLDEEIADVRTLYDKNLVQKPRLLSLERRKAEIEGSIADLQSQVARADQSALESRLRVAELRTATLGEVMDQLRAATAQAYELGQKLAAVQDVVQRTEIRSPLDGTVVGLKVHTTGGVISAGQPLLDVVPSEEGLVVEAQVDPKDIDVVKPGLPAAVRLSAYNRRSHKPIEGRVRTVSADRLMDARTGQPYYLVRIELKPDSAALEQIKLQAGMSGEVMIRTGARTAIDYLLAPITRGLDRSMREH